MGLGKVRVKDLEIASVRDWGRVRYLGVKHFVAATIFFPLQVFF
jgi:hypothetical protein